MLCLIMIMNLRVLTEDTMNDDTDLSELKEDLPHKPYLLKRRGALSSLWFRLSDRRSILTSPMLGLLSRRVQRQSFNLFHEHVAFVIVDLDLSYSYLNLYFPPVYCGPLLLFEYFKTYFSRYLGRYQNLAVETSID